MKISSILEHIEYQKPTSAKGCENGWSLQQVADRLSSQADPKWRITVGGYSYPEPESVRVNRNAPELDTSSLRDELKRGFRKDQSLNQFNIIKVK